MAVGTVSDATVLFLQAIAASFMAADYFFSEDQRKPINDAIKKGADGIQEKIVEDGLKLTDKIFVQNFGRTLAALIFLSATLITLFSLKWLASIVSGGVMLIFLLLFLLLFSVAVIALLDVVVNLTPLALLGLPIWLVSWFVKYCKKGSVFGIGFLFLIASFVCRYLNLP